jgi:hypothetical protein
MKNEIIRADGIRFFIDYLIRNYYEGMGYDETYFARDLRTLLYQTKSIVAGMVVLAALFDKKYDGPIILGINKSNFKALRLYFERYHNILPINFDFGNISSERNKKYNIVGHWLFCLRHSINVLAVVVNDHVSLINCMASARFSISETWLDYNDIYTNYPKHIRDKKYSVDMSVGADNDALNQCVTIFNSWGLKELR